MNEELIQKAETYLEQSKKKKFFRLFSNKDEAYSYAINYFGNKGNDEKLTDETKGIFACSWKCKYYNKSAFINDLIKLPLILIGIVVSHQAEVEFSSTHYLSKKEYILLRSNPSIGTLVEILVFGMIFFSGYLLFWKQTTFAYILGPILMLLSIVLYIKKTHLGYPKEIKKIAKMNFKLEKTRQIG